jgi:excisionase family DNA binding protein
MTESTAVSQQEHPDADVLHESREGGPRFADKRLLSLEETAFLLSLSKRSVEKLVETGRLQTVTVGKRRLVSRNQLDGFVLALEAEQARSLVSRGQPFARRSKG